MATNESSAKKAAKKRTPRKTAVKRKKVGKTEDTKPKPPAKPRKRRHPTVIAVEKILKSVQKRLTSEEVKASLGDYIRLLQLQKEICVDEPKEIRVRWVDTVTESSKEI
jgi:hypothetical protein